MPEPHVRDAFTKITANLGLGIEYEQLETMVALENNISAELFVFLYHSSLFAFRQAILEILEYIAKAEASQTSLEDPGNSIYRLPLKWVKLLYKI